MSTNTNNTQPQPQGFAFDKTFALQMAAAQGFAASQMLKMKDPDNEGVDDLAGTLFQVGAELAGRYASGMDVKSVDQNLLAAHTALGSYLKQRGVITGD